MYNTDNRIGISEYIRISHCGYFVCTTSLLIVSGILLEREREIKIISSTKIITNKSGIFGIVFSN